MSIEFANWFNFFEFLYQETKKLIKDLMAVSDTLDSEFLYLLTNLDSCLDNSINITKGHPVANIYLDTWSAGFYEFRLLCEQLAKYLEENYKEYKNEYHFLERR